jgi:2-dehydro-3-deoxyglucarate aldolase
VSIRPLPQGGLKARLARKELSIGSWLTFGFPPVAEMLARSGFEWLVVDQEHTAIGQSEAQALIQVISLAGCIPLVRVASNDLTRIKHALDAGAHGVVVPMVNSAADARAAVAAAHYPPVGIRGAGLSRAQDYGLGFQRYQGWAKAETVVIVQIEHHEAVDALESILAVDGVDGFIVGPYDLSASLGLAGEWEHPTVRGALERVEAVMRGHAKPGGFHVVHSDREALKRRIDAGYRFISWGDDMVFLAEKLRDEVAAARALGWTGPV